MPEEATLRDASVNPDPVADPPKTDPTPDPTTIKVADTEAAEIGKALLEAGFTKEQVPDLLQAPGALNALRHLVQNDPEEFFKQLEKTDPSTGSRFLQQMSDIYLKRNEHLLDKGKGGKKGDEDSELRRQLAELTEKVTKSEERENQRNAMLASAAVKQRYDSRLDQIFEQDEIKKLGFTKSEVKGMKARITNELAQDSAAAKRVNNGNFVDIPKTFQNILDEWTTDAKQKIETEKSARERTALNAFPEFQSGPQNFHVDPKSFDSWDATEDALAKALAGAAR